MFSKTNLISTLITTIWGFLGGYLLWGIIADPFLMNHLGSATGVPKEAPNFGLLALGCLITGFIFSTIYSKWARGHNSLSEGFKFGALIGVLLGFGNGIIDQSTTNIMDMTGSIVNGFVYVIHFAIMGILASMIYKKLSN